MPALNDDELTWWCAFSADGSLVATAGTGKAWITRLGSPSRLTLEHGHDEPLSWCIFSPDGSLLATGSQTTARLCTSPPAPALDARRARAAARVRRVQPGRNSCDREQRRDGAFGRRAAPSARFCAGTGTRSLVCVQPHGAVLATASFDRTVRIWDVASGAELWSSPDTRSGYAGWRSTATEPCSRARAAPRGSGVRSCPRARCRRCRRTRPTATTCSMSAPTPRPSRTPWASPRSRHRPPLSIGLFGDWGSGKTFFIHQVQDRVQLARTSRAAGESAFCRHVRNIEFNAWHYAHANLWAALVSHIFDELGQPEPDGGVDVTSAQTARLWQELAANSARQERLRRAEANVSQLERHRRRLFLLALVGGAVGGEGGGGRRADGRRAERSQGRRRRPSRAVVLVAGRPASAAGDDGGWSPGPSASTRSAVRRDGRRGARGHPRRDRPGLGSARRAHPRRGQDGADRRGSPAPGRRSTRSSKPRGDASASCARRSPTSPPAAASPGCSPSAGATTAGSSGWSRGSARTSSSSRSC